MHFIHTGEHGEHKEVWGTQNNAALGSTFRPVFEC
jgi:hypothetical protein